MFRLASSNGAKAVPRTAGNSAVARHFTSTTAEAGPSDAGIEDEQWVAADVAFGSAEFSDPLTVAELETSRNQILSGLSTLESASDANDALDADSQMEHIQLYSNAAFQRTQQQSIFAAALNMAADRSVQDACMESLKSNPAVFEAFSSLAAQHGMKIAIDPHHTTRRLALEPAGAAVAAAAPHVSRSPLGALLDSVGNVLGDAGAAVAAYVQRMQRRVVSLLRFLHLREADEEAADTDAKRASSKDILFDVVFSSASLIVIVALLARGVRM